MNSFSRHLNPDSEEQAALWAARLEGGSLDVADQTALHAWLEKNPAHRTLLAQYCQFSADLEEQLPVLLAVGAVSLPPDKMSARRQSIRKFPLIVLAAAAAVVFGFWLARPAKPQETIATSAAERQSSTLADGTHVELNARTRLHVEHGRTERRVRLVEGEAFFRVSKDKTRPFIVETPRGTVRVTGTVFDVRCEPDSAFAVTVVEGAVQVQPTGLSGASSAPVPLSAGEALSTRGEAISVQKLSGDTLEEALAWRQGQVVFVRTPLSEALSRFAHYHGRTLTAAPDAADQVIGGRFSLDDLDGFLAALEEALPVRVNRHSNGNVQVLRRRR